MTAPSLEHAALRPWKPPRGGAPCPSPASRRPPEGAWGTGGGGGCSQKSRLLPGEASACTFLESSSWERPAKGEGHDGSRAPYRAQFMSNSLLVLQEGGEFEAISCWARTLTQLGDTGSHAGPCLRDVQRGRTTLGEQKPRGAS